MHHCRVASRHLTPSGATPRDPPPPRLASTPRHSAPPSPSLHHTIAMAPPTGIHGPLLLEEPLVRVSTRRHAPLPPTAYHLPPPAPPSRFAAPRRTLTPQTPYELLRRSHRSAQRQVEKEFNFVQVSAYGGRCSVPRSAHLLSSPGPTSHHPPHHSLMRWRPVTGGERHGLE
jgi:hypothetical protein